MIYRSISRKKKYKAPVLRREKGWALARLSAASAATSGQGQGGNTPPTPQNAETRLVRSSSPTKIHHHLRISKSWPPRPLPPHGSPNLRCPLEASNPSLSAAPDREEVTQSAVRAAARRCRSRRNLSHEQEKGKGPSGAVVRDFKVRTVVHEPVQELVTVLLFLLRESPLEGRKAGGA